MEITGRDTMIFTLQGPREIYRRVAAGVLARWPTALIESLDDEESTAVPAAQVARAQLPAEDGDLLFLRDVRMGGHLEEAGYVLMPDGDGPFAVLSRARRGVQLRCQEVEEVRVTDDPPRVAPPEPYTGWLCSPLVYEITVVTPGAPEEDPFSRWVCDMVRAACAALT